MESAGDSQSATSGSPPAAVDGGGLRALIEASARAVDCNQAEINSLNVFPVPDGDTGTNMSLTLASVVEDARRVDTTSAGDLSAVLARSALLGARGNSGLILAQFFAGMASAFSGKGEVDGAAFAAALKTSAEAAYAAVENPVEGTMLTVLRRSAEAAAASCEKSAAFADVLADVSDVAKVTVAETPQMLDVLAKAGVVDSGGHGLSVMFAGALSSLLGESDGSIELRAPVVAGAEGGEQLREFLEAATEIVFGYCTAFVIEGENLQIESIREQVRSMGESSVVAGDSRQVKVHVHPLNPGPVLTYAGELGTLSVVDIKNMDEQTRGRAAESVVADAATFAEHQFGVAVVAVAAGEGMRKIFAESGMGASSVVAGGDTMNPSVGELVSAVEAAPADSVIILPNNKNIVGTAGQVDGLSSKTVAVVPTMSMQDGVAALLAFSPDSDLDSNTAAMAEAADQVNSAAVTKATRNFDLDGQNVKVGDVIGILNDEIVASGNSGHEVALRLLSRSDIEGELVTIYIGAEVESAESEALASAIEQLRDDWEVEVVSGGQPYYPFLISIE